MYSKKLHCFVLFINPISGMLIKGPSQGPMGNS
nr:MAG TPA: hypothetical protein [Bacteriophage sp.]